jgi:dipeptidyl aminopeptidase/acylaminoacyl peptidase
LKKVDVSGAPPQTLCDASGTSGGTWNRDGLIVFAPTQNGPLFRVTAAGGVPVQVTQLDTSRQEIAHRHPYFLPDGLHFLLTVVTTRLTFNPGFDDSPMWSPDGSRIVFSSNRSGAGDLYQKSSSGVGQDEVLLKSDHGKIPDDWSSDGRFILYQDLDPKTGWDLWALALTRDRKPQPLLTTSSHERQGRFSPDGRWMAYVSDESGTNQVYVQSFPLSGGKWQISTSGGVQPRWRRDGKELFFMADAASGITRDAMAVEVDTSDTHLFRATIPQKLFTLGPYVSNSAAGARNSWDVTPDGQRFLVVSNPTATAVPPVTVVVNWLQGRNTR